MITNDRVRATMSCDATVDRKSSMQEQATARGRFVFECFDKDGKLKWRDEVDNVVQTEGKDLAFDTFLSGVDYSVVGPFMGLISAVNFVGVLAGDTAAEINNANGWTEAGGSNVPTYMAPRPLVTWQDAAGGAKQMAAALPFNFTSGGTVKGAFIIFGPNASNTIDDPAGTLWSAGLFTTGDKVVGNGDTLNVSYSTSM